MRYIFKPMAREKNGLYQQVKIEDTFSKASSTMEISGRILGNPGRMIAFYLPPTQLTHGFTPFVTISW